MNESIIKKYLKETEEVLWNGKAEKVPFFNKYDIFLVPLTLFLGLYLIAYNISFIYLMIQGDKSASLIFPVIGLLLFLISFYLIFGRLWFRRKKIKNDIYVITNQRALIINTLRSITVYEIKLSEIQLLVGKNYLLLEKSNFTGDVLFALGLSLFYPDRCFETPGFYNLCDVDAVTEIFRSAGVNS